MTTATTPNGGVVVTDGDRTTWQDVIDAHTAATAVAHADAHDPNLPDPRLPLSDVQVYRTVSITEVGLAANGTVDVSNPVDLLDDDEMQAPQRPAIGVLLDMEQGWRMRGLAKGRLLHSLCLAPGEVTQIAMVGWQRGTSGDTTEEVGEQEAAGRTADRTRTTAEVTRTVANETQAGGSSSSSFAAQMDAGVGGLAGLLGASGGTSMNTGIAGTASFSVGSRDATADSRQQVRQRTAQAASNVRSRTATLVQEVHQSETEQFSSRVVANYNHMHALNMQYYEVLQVYELSARPTHAERCIFLPMAVMQFDVAKASTYAVPLARAARAMGRPVLAAAIEQNALDQERAEAAVAALERTVQAAELRSTPLARDLAAIESRRDIAESKAAELNMLLAELVGRRGDATTRLEAAEREFGEFNMLNAQTPEFRRFLGTESRLALLDIAGIENRRQGAMSDLAAADARLATLLPELAATQVEFAKLTAEATGTAGLLRAQQATLAAADTALQQVQAAAAAEAGALVRELNEDGLALNQALWLQMDPATVRTLVSGWEYDGQPIADTVDPVPVALVGTYLGFRWGFARTEAGSAAAADFRRRYVDDHQAAALDTHVLPTGGLFAESVLGRSNAAEELDLTRFWRWDDDTIPILPTAISTLQSANRVQRAEVVPGMLGAPAAQLGTLPTAPAGPAHALAGLIGSSLFRDMSGSAVIGGLLESAQKVVGTEAKRAQEIAHQNISAFLDHAEQLLPQLSKAITSGNLDPSTLGALSNSLGKATGAAGATGEKGAGFDPGALIGLAAKIGIAL